MLRMHAFITDAIFVRIKNLPQNETVAVDMGHNECNEMVVNLKFSLHFYISNFNKVHIFTDL